MPSSGSVTFSVMFALGLQLAGWPGLQLNVCVIVLGLVLCGADVMNTFPFADWDRLQMLQFAHNQLSQVPDDCLRAVLAVVIEQTNHCTLPQDYQPTALGVARIDVATLQPQPSDLFAHASEPSNMTRSALAVFFAATNGPQWKNNSLWLSQSSVCSWHGITCAIAGASGSIEVTHLKLDNNSLSGDLARAVSKFSTLRWLEQLDLRENELTGTVPALEGLVNLRTLWLSSNLLRGTLPLFSDLTHLRSIQMVANQLRGAIPDWRTLRLLCDINLSFNQLSGSLSDFSQLTMLTSFQAFHNQLSGTLPSFDALKNLRSLRLSDNALEGTLPSFSNHTLLARMDLDSNNFIGTVPEFSHLVGLQYLYLEFNRLSGTIPSFAHAELLALSLDGNALRGTVPSFSNCPRLKDLILNGNMLEGTIPSFLSSPSLESLDVGSNRLIGTVPSFSWLPFLRSLDVSFNYLTGSAHLAAPALRSVFLSSNRFQSSLNFSLSPNLALFDGSHNYWYPHLPASLPRELKTFRCINCSLHGHVPSSWTRYRALSIVELGQNRLTGPLPSLFQLKQLDLSQNAITGSFNDVLFPLWHFTENPTPAIPSSIEWLNLASNNISGPLNMRMFYCGGSYVSSLLFCGIKVLLLAHNPLSGPLPNFSAGDASYSIFDLSFTNVSGEVPGVFFLMPSQALYLEGSQVTAKPSSASNFVRPDYSSQTTQGNCSCPSFFTPKGAHVTLSPSAYHYSLCNCLGSFFGRNGRCQSCLGLCEVCERDVVVGCMPLGGQLIPCQRTSRGDELCNPYHKPWPLFHNESIIEHDYHALAKWCLPGTEGRLCSKCGTGFYADGRDCLECQSFTWQLFLLLAHVLALVVVVVIFWLQSVGRHERKSDTLSVLMFHCQQLGLLLATEGSFSRALSAFIAGTAAAAASASPQTALALECFGNFGVPERVIVGLLSLALLVVLLLCLYTVQFCSPRFSSGNAFGRVGSVLVSLIGLVLLPTAQTSFAAMACTDGRSSSMLFLNQYPWLACDAKWRNEILPAASVGVALCIVVAIVLSAYGWKPQWFFRPGQEAHDAFAGLSAPFRHRFRAWFAVILLRRLLLAATFSFVPYYSSYLSLAVVAVIQGSAVLQHFSHPFADNFDNRAELASLYVLLINYFSSLVRNFAAANVVASLDVWFFVLLSANVVFVLLLAVRVVFVLVRNRPLPKSFSVNVKLKAAENEDGDSDARHMPLLHSRSQL